MRSGTLTALLLMSVIFLSFVSGKREKAKTYFTEYTNQKRTYCLFQGHQILPGSKWSTPSGCLKCKCTKRFLNCRPITKSKRRMKNLGCF